jgi:acyl-CoA reductase-like NAD-dependent aldehyde dehydrogenase
MTSLVSFSNLVNGAAALVSDTFESYNPYTGKPWARIPRCKASDVEEAVSAAHMAFRSGPWRIMTPSARGRLLVRLADLIADNADRLAALETRDNGKLISEMTAQVRYIPERYRYFGGLADKIEGAVLPIDKAGMFAYTRREPVGAVAAIAPWNSPLLLLTWKLAPLLAAGNTVVIKPSEHASASTLAFVELFSRAGFPSGVVNTVTGFPSQVGAPLVAHPLVAKIAFTGREAGGLAVYRSAAEGLKTVTLELGGKSANLVFADADIESAVNGGIAGIFAATGQTCIAGSRLLVERKVHDRVVDEGSRSPKKLGSAVRPTPAPRSGLSRPRLSAGRSWVTSISRNRRARGASLAAANLMRPVSRRGGSSSQPSSRWCATACASPRKRC